MELKNQANQLKNNKLLTDIFAEREQDIISSWRSAVTIEDREQCATDLRSLESLRECLDSKLNGILGDFSKSINNNNSNT